MKCLLCLRDDCVCYYDAKLPTKSTLSPSVTEFPDSYRIRKKSNEVAKNQSAERPTDWKISRDSMNSLHSKANKPLVQRRFHHDEDSRKHKVIPSSTSLPTHPVKIETQPFVPFQQYIELVKGELQDCTACSKIRVKQSRPPSEPSLSQHQQVI